MTHRISARWPRFVATLATIGAISLLPAVAGSETPRSVIAVRLVTATKTHDITAEIACTREERAHGLMGRQSLAPDEGMIFLFAFPRELSFWMKDTPLSLDMLFIDSSGKINQITKYTKPMSEDRVTSNGPMSAVLELAAGRADAYGLAVGDRVFYNASTEHCD